MIVIEGLSYRYGHSEVYSLNNINLHIRKGSLFGLLGPNGAGKTTLISILVGLLSNHAGSVSIAGYELRTASKNIKSLHGYVPQDYAFYSNLTAQENLQFFAGIQFLTGKHKNQRIDYCFDFCQLASVRKQRVATFSGGLKRRLNLAIGLLHDPEMIYLDEPTVGIDPQSRAFILDNIKQLNCEGKTIIYSSHYMEEIEKLCDQIAILDRGKVITNGTLQELNAQRSGVTSIRLKNILSKEQANQLYNGFQFEDIKGRLHFSQVNSTHQLNHLINLLDELNVQIEQLTFGQDSLEQLFLDLTDRKLRD